MAKLKTIVSLIFAIPAALIVCSETGAEYFWLQLLALTTIIAVLFWNGTFKKERSI